MVKKKPLSYQEKLNAIKEYTALGINSRKYNAKNPNFSKTEKWLITRYYNISKESGYFDYNAKNKEFNAKVKFVKSKKKRMKGSPRIAGYVVPGASPTDIVRGNKIIKDNFIKTFIPLDFGDLPPDSESDEFYEAVYDEISTKIDPYFEEIGRGDYFTIVLSNGWEIGQNKRKNTPKKKRKDGQGIGKELTAQNKLDKIVDKVVEILQRAINKYQTKINLVSGLYLWQFKNQREPNPSELKIIKGRKKKK